MDILCALSSRINNYGIIGVDGKVVDNGYVLGHDGGLGDDADNDDDIGSGFMV